MNADAVEADEATTVAKAIAENFIFTIYIYIFSFIYLLPPSLFITLLFQWKASVVGSKRSLSSEWRLIDDVEIKEAPKFGEFNSSAQVSACFLEDVPSQ